MSTYDKDGHLYGGDGVFNLEYFKIGNETSGKTYINIENEQVEIHNLKEPSGDNDAATKKYVDDNAGGGGGSSNIEVITWDGDTMTDAELGEAVIAVLEAGKVPLIESWGYYYYYEGGEYNIEESYAEINFFMPWQQWEGDPPAITQGGIVFLWIRQDTGTWTVNEASLDIDAGGGGGGGGETVEYPKYTLTNTQESMFDVLSQIPSDIGNGKVPVVFYGGRSYILAEYNDLDTNYAQFTAQPVCTITNSAVSAIRVYALTLGYNASTHLFYIATGYKDLT